jgi:hypothetical protein
MALINVLNITVHNNPAGFLDPFQFEVTFECTGKLEDDLEWRVIYVGSAESSDYDQELDNVLVGPVPEGTNRFVLNVRVPPAFARPALARPALADGRPRRVQDPLGRHHGRDCGASDLFVQVQGVHPRGVLREQLAQRARSRGRGAAQER